MEMVSLPLEVNNLSSINSLTCHVYRDIKFGIKLQKGSSWK